MTSYYSDGNIVNHEDESEEYDSGDDEWYPKYHNTHGFSLKKYCDHNKEFNGQSVLYIGKAWLFIVNVEVYSDFVIKNGIVYAVTEDSEVKIKNYSEKLRNLIDVTSLTNEEIQNTISNLTRYLITFVDYINRFDDDYLFCATKKSE